MNKIPGSKKGNSFKWAIFAICATAIVSLIVTWQQGKYIQIRLLTNANQQATVNTEDIPNTPVGNVDDYTKLEGYCESAKQAHINDCGMMPPEHDFMCRNQEVDDIFKTCLKNTPQDLVNDENYFRENNDQ